MTVWQRLLRQPQRVWIRRAVFQIHLWTGIAIGLYVVMLSLTGSALVYRNELDRWFRTPRPTFEPAAARLSTEQLREAAATLYPGYEVTRVGDRITRRNPVIEIWVERDGAEKGAALQSIHRRGPRRLDHEGRAGSSCGWCGSTTNCCSIATGKYVERRGQHRVHAAGGYRAVVWWPGVTRWKRSLGDQISAAAGGASTGTCTARSGSGCSCSC